jgi:predicted nuclease of predicted toxin-antitoxin system
VKIVVDMNLSPEWLEVFAQAVWQARHWSQIGRPNADDDEIFSWAAENDHLVFTQDLDFPQILFASQGGRPSVVLLRIKNELGAVQRARVCAAIRQASASLQTGAIMVIDDRRIRLRTLPIEI